ncbi:MAG: hypothetical protein D6E12_06230 [Desulfovibrio sp.]|nr:MAG: hypothetical protein D6E12_06230 [Desulfovibrio sp.]
MAIGAMWILFIRDQHKLRRFRMRTFLVLFTLTILLLITGLVSGFFGIRWLGDNAEIRQEIASLDQAMVAIQEETAQVQEHVDALEASGNWEANGNTPATDDEPLEAAPSETETSEQETAEPPPPAGQDNSTLAEDPADPPPPPIDLFALFRQVDLGIVTVTELSFSRQGDTRLAVAYDLSNISGTTQRGNGEVLLILRRGQEVVMPTEPGDLRFEIRNFKKVTTTGTLPPDLTWEDVHAVGLRLFDRDERTIFRVIRPLNIP